MVKLVNEYGQPIAPSHVYRCDDKSDLDTIVLATMGDIAYVIHDGDLYMCDSKMKQIKQPSNGMSGIAILG